MTEPVYIGLGTPQANPTVEVEFRQLWRAPVQPVVTRLTSSADAPNDRLIDYLEQLPGAIASFDTLPLRAFAFACTGSAYLLGAAREEKITEAAERAFRIQVVTATQAIRRELQGRGARRIAMLAPYPDDLCAAAAEYWDAFGVDVVNPRDESVNGVLIEADAGEVDKACTAARKAFDEGPWPRMPVAERQQVLRQAGAELAKHGDELAELECEDAGLPMHEIRSRHVPRMRQNFEYVASLLRPGMRPSRSHR